MKEICSFRSAERRDVPLILRYIRELARYEKLEEEVGEALGQEAALADVSVLLAPGLNLKRNPLCGRNFEYFAEDP